MTRDTRKSTVLQSGAQRTLLIVRKTKELTVDFRKKRRHIHTSVEIRWSRWTILGSYEWPSLRTYPIHLSTLVNKKKKKKGKLLPWYQVQHRGRSTTGGLYITGAQLQSIIHISELWCLYRAQRVSEDNTHPSHSQSTHCCTARPRSSFSPQAVGLLNFFRSTKYFVFN